MTLKHGDYYRDRDGAIWCVDTGGNSGHSFCVVDAPDRKEVLTGSDTADEDYGPFTRVYPTWSETPPPPVFEFGDKVRVLFDLPRYEGPGLGVVIDVSDTEPCYLVYVAGHGASLQCSNELAPWDES